MTDTTDEPLQYELTIESPITELLFEPDLTAEIEEDPLTIIHPTQDNTTWEQRKKMKEYAEQQGFTPGCTVVDRKLSPRDRIDPESWGFVVAVVSYCYGTKGTYAPLRCCWLDGSTTYHFPSELIVVNFAPDDIDLGMISRGE
jgi:hypothetical protein